MRETEQLSADGREEREIDREREIETIWFCFFIEVRTERVSNPS